MSKQFANEIASLDGKPNIACTIEYQRVWIPSFFIGHFEFSDLARIRIKLAYISVAVSCKPDESRRINDEIVWPCATA